ncbi:MAG: NAD(P)H-hydrate dehydratase [Deltaproteobacteria bacterium]|jgi:NAD(P)H-hydrate epimerase|nr:NAD(P)H-hydrate dehydratase [Deltaproteobacteria bacterium]
MPPAHLLETPARRPSGPSVARPDSLTAFSTPLYVVTSEESRALDRAAMEIFGLPGLALMETAARSVLAHLLDFWPMLRRGVANVLVLCGPGQNGGDGFVLARLLDGLGHKVECRLLCQPGQKPRGDAAVNLAVALRLGLHVVVVDSDDIPPPESGDVDLIIDAVFGTGLARPLEGQVLRTFRHLKSCKTFAKVAAVDLPSGLSADDGTASPYLLPADLTVTLGAYKRGLFLRDGPAVCGQARLGDIGLHPAMAEKVRPSGRLIDARAAAALTPDRPEFGHKGLFGRAWLVGGARGKTGALVLAALGAQRAGCGLVTAAHPASLSNVVSAQLVSAMTAPLPEEADGRLGLAAAEALAARLGAGGALGLGPGLGLGPAETALTEKLAVELEGPVVLDADALTALAGRLEILQKARGPRVLTPHSGEAGRLLGRSAADVEADRPGAALELARRSGAVTVLKGRRTITVCPESLTLHFNDSGGQHLAVGGSGDLLTGLIVGLTAQRLKPLPAAILGVHVHGLAGDLAAERLGAFGLIPEQIAEFVPEVWRRLTTLRDEDALAKALEEAAQRRRLKAAAAGAWGWPASEA